MSKPLVFLANGSQVRLGERIGRGGEGEVYALANDPSHAVKIYSGDKGPDRREKVSAMVGAKLSERTPLAAFPIYIVQTQNGKFAGFIMRKVSGHKPLFELYAPGARKNNFPKANYPFLVQTALNFANAVGAVHSTGCVIGDINHSGILIAENAIVSLIDADSFQVVEGSKRYLCRVGVPDYTPPELQETKLDTIIRTTNHDNFGVAIVIFQLLFMGRHPFSGSYQHGEMPIERAIGEHRFVYGTKRNVGMKAPPAAPLLKHFPPPLGEAFEAAFGPASIRPTPRDWIGLLQELKRTLRGCKNDPLHHHWQGSPECPWCRIEKLQGITLFLPPVMANSAPGTISASVGSFNLEAVWRVIEAAIPPTGGAVSPVLHPVTPQPTVEAAKLRGTAVEQKTIGVVSSVVAAAILFASPALWLLWIPAGWFGFAKLFGAGADVGKLKSKKRELEQQWQVALGDWTGRCSSEGFEKLKSELADAKRQYQGLSSEQAQRVAKYQQNRRAIHLKKYLSTFYIRSARISGVGPSKTATLASYGIETAADVTSGSKIEGVPGFGPATASNLLAWRHTVESRFVYNPSPNATDQAELATIKADIAKRELQLRQQLSAGPEGLNRATRDALGRRQAVDPALQRLHERMAQIDADLQHVHGKAGQPIAWIVGAITALVIIVTIAGQDWSVPEAPVLREQVPPANLGEAELPAPPAESGKPEIPPPDEVTESEKLLSDISYAVRVTNVRARASTDAPIVGELGRGAGVRGVTVTATGSSTRWLKITEGAYAGYYVSAEANLSELPRPTLDTSYSGSKMVILPTSALSEASWDASPVRDLEPGTVLRIVGATESGLAEASLRTGAIVYVDMDALDEEDPSAGQDTATDQAPNTPTEPQFVQRASPAVPLRSLASIISDADYPDSAIRADEEGRTGFKLDIDELGRVTNCTIEQSSGSTNLDEATCRLMMSRAQFSPARDTAGNPIADAYSSAISWSLP